MPSWRLSRLLSAANPESGTISYTYDADGNLQTKRDARGIKTVYDYDALNRVTKRCYRSIGTGPLGMTTCSNNTETVEPNTPDVSYTYDNLANAKGKLIKVSSAVSTTEYLAFDVMGRVTRSRQTTGGVVGSISVRSLIAGPLAAQCAGEPARATVATSRCPVHTAQCRRSRLRGTPGRRARR